MNEWMNEWMNGMNALVNKWTYCSPSLPSQSSPPAPPRRSCLPWRRSWHCSGCSTAGQTPETTSHKIEWMGLMLETKWQINSYTCHKTWSNMDRKCCTSCSHHCKIWKMCFERFLFIFHSYHYDWLSFHINTHCILICEKWNKSSQNQTHNTIRQYAGHSPSLSIFLKYRAHLHCFTTEREKNSSLKNTALLHQNILY